jgi:hypothetical protein
MRNVSRARAGQTIHWAVGGSLDDENSQTYNFRASTITLGRIKEIVEKGYFADGEAQAPGSDAASEPDCDEAVVYDDFFVAGLCMPPHLALANMLLMFQAQLHQLTPNAIV